MTTRFRTTTCFLSALATSVALAASPALATITGSGDISPTNPAGWTGSTTAYIGNSSKTIAGVVLANGGNTLNCNTAYLGYNTGTTGTVTVDGSASKWNTYDLYVGDAGTGTVNITNGGSINISDQCSVGWTAGSTGTVNVNGAGSTWTISVGFSVGVDGTGTMTVKQGGAVTSKDGIEIGQGTKGSGIVTVDGTGTWTNTGWEIIVGATEAGTLKITNGGAVTNTGGATSIGDSHGAQGQVTVAGSGSALTTAAIYVGNSGAGTLAINSGGSVTSTSPIVGYATNSTGSVTIDGTGSKWTTTGTLMVGYNATGTLGLTNGGHLSTDSSGANVGFSTGGNGAVTVDGSGSVWTNAGDLHLGNSGGAHGTLAITNGGQVSDGNGDLQSSAALTATVDGTGSTWTNSGGLYIGYYGNAGMQITHAGHVSSVGGYIGNWAGSVATATIDGAGSTWTNTGALYVGYSGNGTLNLSNGGTVNTTGTTYAAYYSGSVGTISFGSGGGTLTTQAIFASPGQLQGTGTINARGLVSDVNLVFDGTHGLSQALTVNSTGQNVTINLDLSGSSGAVGALGAGYKGSGALTIQGGVTVNCAGGYLGYWSGAVGTATVDGTGSAWNINSALYVGDSGTGTLNITNGSTVTAAGPTYLGYNPGAAGAINFGTHGGTLTVNAPLWAAPSQVTGTGTINCQGLVTDGAVVFDATHGSTQTILWTQAGQNVAVNLALGTSDDLGAGYQTAGSVTIRDGVKITNSNADLGWNAGATGTATVSGTGSLWKITSYAYVGNGGTGALNITNGGKVDTSSAQYGFLGNLAGSNGAATIDGAGSTWVAGTTYIGNGGTGTVNITNGGTFSSSSAFGWTVLGTSAGSVGTLRVDGAGSAFSSAAALYVGYSGLGTLTITRGGHVTATSLSISSSSLLAMDIGKGSILSLGTGSLSNSGVVRLAAAPGAAANTYTPITAGTWSGSGTVQALGGTWNSTNHTFTITAAATANAAHAVTFDCHNTQRVLITDPLSDDTVEAAFQATTTSSNLTFTATTLTTAQTSLLQSDLATHWSVLNGWTFATTGYTTGNPVYLSLDVGPGYATSNIAIWHYNGSTWTPYSAPDLSYDGTNANFTVTGFSGYAVTSSVPEPASLVLLTLGAITLLTRRRRAVPFAT